MPNIRSAAKRMRQANVNQARNRTVRNRIHTLRRKFLLSVDGGDKVKAELDYRAFCSAVDKGRKTGVVKSNTADRKKSRAAARLAGIKA